MACFVKILHKLSSISTQYHALWNQYPGLLKTALFLHLEHLKHACALRMPSNAHALKHGENYGLWRTLVLSQRMGPEAVHPQVSTEKSQR
jgi:hypothetical protein